jgi:hypothetical protein
LSFEIANDFKARLLNDVRRVGRDRHR